MNRTASGSFRIGDRVEGLTHFTRVWVDGFEVASTHPAGCHVRRTSDGEARTMAPDRAISAAAMTVTVHLRW